MGTTVILDVCALVCLRMSEPNKKLKDRSVYRVVNSPKFRRMQKVSNKLRKYLNKMRKRGVKFCSSRQTWFLADRVYVKETETLARSYHEFRMARFLLDNAQYREDIKDLTSNCDKVDGERWEEIKEEVRVTYPTWLDRDIEQCMKKRGSGKKNPHPEHEDLIRLSEAISNKEKSGNKIVLVTGDAHFICYETKIKDTFDIDVYNYHK